MAQSMRIGVLRDYKVSRISFSYDEAVYEVYGDTSYLGKLDKFQFVELQLSGGKIKLEMNTVSKGSFSKIIIRSDSTNSSIALKSKIPSVRERKYEDDFEIKVVKGRMAIVNLVSMDDYLSGVIESEGGGGRHIEYYRVQALMSRTYALKNRSRHNKEGFELCDGVHCQAYHYMLRYTPEIRTAVKTTSREVLVDQNNRLVATYFSANCGGQVCDASYVWNSSVPYVNTFKDTFCIHTRQATWTKRIPQTKWRNFLVQQYGYPIHDQQMASMIFYFDQPERKAFYIHPSLGIPLRDLRTEFKLKSTFFSAHPEGTDVVLEGRGFGHGVGLCQEGAMEMAKSGYNYRQIALFYFDGLKIIKTIEE